MKCKVLPLFFLATLISNNAISDDSKLSKLYKYQEINNYDPVLYTDTAIPKKFNLNNITSSSVVDIKNKTLELIEGGNNPNEFLDNALLLLFKATKMPNESWAHRAIVDFRNKFSTLLSELSKVEGKYLDIHALNLTYALETQENFIGNDTWLGVQPEERIKKVFWWEEQKIYESSNPISIRCPSNNNVCHSYDKYVNNWNRIINISDLDHYSLSFYEPSFINPRKVWFLISGFFGSLKLYDLFNKTASSDSLSDPMKQYIKNNSNLQEIQYIGSRSALWGYCILSSTLKIWIKNEFLGNAPWKKQDLVFRIYEGQKANIQACVNDIYDHYIKN